MDEEERMCVAPEGTGGEHEEHDSFGHAIHGAELLHAAEHASHAHAHAPMSTPRVAPGSGGPHDPQYWSEPATGRDLDDIMGALGAEAVRTESLAPPVPARAPITEDQSIMLEQMRAAGYDAPSPDAAPFESPNRAIIEEHMDGIYARHAAGPRIAMSDSTGDPTHVAAYGEDIVYPPMDGARDGIITPDRSRVGEVWTRRGGPGGDYFAEGDPSLPSRALPPRYTPWGERAPDYIGTDTTYRVGASFPIERSEAAPWFDQPGGAAQLRTPMSAGALERGRYLELEQSVGVDYANFDETCEILSAVHGSGDADDLAALAEMNEANAFDGATAAASDAGDATSAAGGAGWFGQLLGGAGAVGGLLQMATGVDELLDGDLDMGFTDLVAGGGNAFTGMLAAVGEGAAVAPPLGLGAAVLGAAATGHHYNQAAGTFGTDDEGHNRSSVDFAIDMSQDSYDYVHDGIAGAIDGGEEGGLGDYVGWGAGSVAGVAGGALGGLIGFGGDLRYGVTESIGGLYDTVTGFGDARWQEDDLWGAPTVDPDSGEVHHVSSREMIEDSAHGTFDTVHDGIMGLTGDEGAMGVAGEIAGTTLGVGAGALVGLGGGVVGGLAALGGTINRGASALADGASHLWSWMTD